jgi:hypothetical protein
MDLNACVMIAWSRYTMVALVKHTRVTLQRAHTDHARSACLANMPFANAKYYMHLRDSHDTDTHRQQDFPQHRYTLPKKYYRLSGANLPERSHAKHTDDTQEFVSTCLWTICLPCRTAACARSTRLLSAPGLLRPFPSCEPMDSSLLYNIPYSP